MTLKELDDKAQSQLASLDQRFVAAAAPRLARAVDGAGAALRRTKETTTGLVRDVDLRDLRTLDERYAAKGPLALFREIPQLLAIVVGIVFVIGTIAAAHDLGARQQRAEDQTVAPGDGGSGGPSSGPTSVIVLGPTVGKPTSDYLALAAKSLDDAAVAAPDEQRLALVTLSSYYRPDIVSTIVSGLVVKRAWVRDSAAGKLAPPMPVELTGDVAQGLRAFYARTAKGQAEAAGQYQQLADTTANDPQYKAFYEQFATLSRKQAAAFGHDCACVYSFAVLATPTQLQQLRSRPGIRSIEVAGRGAKLTDVDITTLLPEVKGVVPNPAAAVAPPS